MAFIVRSAFICRKDGPSCYKGFLSGRKVKGWSSMGSLAAWRWPRLSAAVARVGWGWAADLEGAAGFLRARPMVTDPARKRRTDPGNPDVCPVFDLHKIFTPTGDREYCATNCRTAGFGCLDCKDVLLKHMVPPLEQIRERRQSFAEKPDTIRQVLSEGSRRARVIAQQTMTQVRDAVKLTP